MIRGRNRMGPEHAASRSWADIHPEIKAGHLVPNLRDFAALSEWFFGEGGDAIVVPFGLSEQFKAVRNGQVSSTLSCVLDLCSWLLWAVSSFLLGVLASFLPV